MVTVKRFKSVPRISLHKEESGIAAIVVTMIIMVLVSVIVLSFSQLVRREQRQALDRQLSTQAFYAAESAVNKIYDTLYNNPGAVDPLYKDDDCNTPTAPSLDLSVVLDSAANFKASCIKIDDAVPELKYQAVGSTPKAVPIRAEGNATITDMTFSWKDNGGSVPCNTNSLVSSNPISLPQAASWSCSMGMLRLEVVPISDTTRSTLETNLFTSFLFPNQSAAGSATMAYNTASGANLGRIAVTRCIGGTCSMTINGLPGGSSYMVRFRTIYGSSEVTISINSGATNIIGSQAIIDVTGRAQDILRRIQVRVPLADANSDAPAYALLGGDGICKRLLISDRETPPTASIDGSGITDPSGACSVSGVSGGGAGGGGGGGGGGAGGGGGGGGGVAGDAEFDTGGLGGTGAGPYWSRNFTNTSTNPPSIVTGCVWDWDDGTVTNDVACNGGDLLSHTFPTIAACTQYNVVLTVRTTLGNYNYTRTVKEPHGSASGC